jgi:hypothetical protein
MSTPAGGSAGAGGSAKPAQAATSAEKWSTREHACHLSGVDRLYIDRLDHILAHPRPVITPYDPARNEADDAFLQMDLERSMTRYVEDRLSFTRTVSRSFCSDGSGNLGGFSEAHGQGVAAGVEARRSQVVDLSWTKE